MFQVVPSTRSAEDLAPPSVHEDRAEVLQLQQAHSLQVAVIRLSARKVVPGLDFRLPGAVLPREQVSTGRDAAPGCEGVIRFEPLLCPSAFG